MFSQYLSYQNLIFITSYTHITTNLSCKLPIRASKTASKGRSINFLRHIYGLLLLKPSVTSDTLYTEHLCSTTSLIMSQLYLGRQLQHIIVNVQCNNAPCRTNVINKCINQKHHYKILQLNVCKCIPGFEKSSHNKNCLYEARGEVCLAFFHIVRQYIHAGAYRLTVQMQ